MIIALIGPKSSGKSTVARYLVKKYGFVRHPFAAPLKNMLRAIGLRDAHVDGELKEMPTNLLCGQTPRHAMQMLGTEWGRNLIDPDLWVAAWRNTMPEGNIVIDDMRFPNEHKFITEEIGGKIIAVRRPGYEYSNAHYSEQCELKWEFRLDNNGTIKQLVKATSSLLVNHFGFVPRAHKMLLPEIDLTPTKGK